MVTSQGVPTGWQELDFEDPNQLSSVLIVRADDAVAPAPVTTHN